MFKDIGKNWKIPFSINGICFKIEEVKEKKSDRKFGQKGVMMDELLKIPGIGSKIARDLKGIGIQKIENLKDRDPEELFVLLCAKAGRRLDRCLLYVLRCAIYFASEESPEPDLLKWWNWKD